jgi:hypothetical protein
MDYEINAKREAPRNTPSQPSGTPGKAGPATEKTAPDPDTSPSGPVGGSLLAAISEETARTERASTAAFRSLSTLKTIGAVLGGLVHHTRGLSQDEINQESQKVLTHYGEQSMKLHKLLGTPTERYVLESITGSVSSLISEHFRIAGSAALNVDWATQLYEGCKLDMIAEQKRGNQDWASPEARRSLATMNAIWPVVSAVQKHNLFHDDKDALIQRMANKMRMMVDETLEENPIVKRMPEAEQDMLHKNLMLRSGQLLSDVWLSNIRETLVEVREMDTEERRQIMASGYPLDRIDREFEQQYAMLERSFQIALKVNYGEDIADTQGPSLN